ncbi:YkgJ family cysteine cluster protein [Geobacter sp. AOG1]|uniref:YkgJ family cysteine cluster protein n=1 Tax=Geobacter sp. AOG1 TaxID=1566346 RepID=UPI001CC492B0|nr:YkgJ family cysteine cluster protein [Geobacter sp. AOG1]GFE57731.1 hypothetical protein AOG1_16110 [Geobacter sp. AOG1]
MATNPSLSELLKNYRELIGRVDELCAAIGEEFPEEIVCRAGCAGCCRHLTLLPVEAIALAVAMYELPPTQADMIRDRARKSAPDGPCPLLMDERCLLYAARPLICRTHGLPLLTRLDDVPQVDFCPENFRGVTNLPGSAVIDLERLNTALVAVDALFRREYFPEGRAGRDRYTIAEALLLQL